MRRRLARIYYGWWIVAVAFAVNAVATGVYYLGFTVLFLPISRDFHIGRAAASLPFSLARLTSVFFSPLAGLAVDRLGPLKVMLVSGVLAGVGFLLLGWSSNYLVFLIVFTLILTPPLQSGLDMPTTAATSKWFVKGSGFAFGLGSVGYAVGGATITPIIALAVQSFGWRNAAFAIGLFVLLVVPPLSFVLRRSPPAASDQNAPNADAQATSQPNASSRPASAAPSVSRDFTLREALATRTYWFIALSYGFRAMVWSAVVVHLVGIMVWKGLEESVASPLVGAFPFFWIPANLGMGWLADRWSPRYVAAAGGFISGLGILLLAVWPQVEIWQMLLVFCLLAPNDGAWPIGWAILGQQFGRKHFGLLRGGILGVVSFMAMGAPFYSGWVYDQTQSYLWVVVPSSLLLAAAGLFIGAMPPASRKLPLALATDGSAPPGSTP